MVCRYKFQSLLLTLKTLKSMRYYVRTRNFPTLKMETVVDTQTDKLNIRVEPKSIEEAEEMRQDLQDSIRRIQNQLDDPERKNSMEKREYGNWHQRAQMSVRHKKGDVQRLSVLIDQMKRRMYEEDSTSNYVTVGRSLKSAAKQYGRLIEVLLAAEDYINSSSEAADETLLTILVEKVRRARELMQKHPDEDQK